MRYAYYDLGERQQGTTVVVRWRGSPADVMLLDPVNFSKYRDAGGLLSYERGGHYPRSPARLTIPEDGRWYVVADFHGHSNLLHATVETDDGEQVAGQEVADGEEISTS